jgi:hypothetical protein
MSTRKRKQEEEELVSLPELGSDEEEEYVTSPYSHCSKVVAYPLLEVNYGRIVVAIVV